MANEDVVLCRWWFLGDSEDGGLDGVCFQLADEDIDASSAGANRRCGLGEDCIAMDTHGGLLMDDSNGEKGVFSSLICEISLQDRHRGMADPSAHMSFQADWQAEYQGLCLKLLEDNIFPCDFD